MIDSLRIGLGTDLHRLELGRPCWLAGLQIPSDRGPVGHSDGDVILHAACDAVLGAAGLEDLGTLFSDKSSANKDRASSEFCAIVMQKLEAQNLRVLSMDVVVETERPKLIPHRDAMRVKLASLFGTTPDRVNLKGKTGETLGAVGRGEAMRCTVVALLAAAVSA